MPHLDLNNTEIAFKAKSDNQLRRAYWMFRLIAPFSNNLLAWLGTAVANVLLALRIPVLRTPLRIMFDQFCGGQSIEECRHTISELDRDSIKTTLDYCIEGVDDENDLDKTLGEVLRNVEEARDDQRIPFCVFKVTSLGRPVLLQKVTSESALAPKESLEYARVENRVNEVCSSALKSNVRILIDAEESWLQGAIDGLATKMMERYNRQQPLVFNTFQMYRKDRIDFLKESYEHSRSNGYFLGVKLVRGAYLEKERTRAGKLEYPSPIHDTKGDTDAAYDLALTFCVENLNGIGLYVGTHNQPSVQLLADLLERNNIKSDTSAVYFSQLFGMGDNITYALALNGYNVAKFVPYGKLELALPYLLRRARENSAVRGEAGRELKLIAREIERRKADNRS